MALAVKATSQTIFLSCREGDPLGLQAGNGGTDVDDAGRKCCSGEMKPVIKWEISGGKINGSPHAYLQTPNMVYGFVPDTTGNGTKDDSWASLIYGRGTAVDQRGYLQEYPNQASTRYKACPETVKIVEKNILIYQKQDYSAINFPGYNCYGWVNLILEKSGLRSVTPPIVPPIYFPVLLR